MQGFHLLDLTPQKEDSIRGVPSDTRGQCQAAQGGMKDDIIIARSVPQDCSPEAAFSQFQPLLHLCLLIFSIMLYLLTQRFCLLMKNVEGKKVKSPCKDPPRYFPVLRTALELCTEKRRSNYRSWGKIKLNCARDLKTKSIPQNISLTLVLSDIPGATKAQTYSLSVTKVTCQC